MVKFVIAKYNENVDWVLQLNHDYIIYDKSGIPVENSIKRPNIGREGETFLYHIIQNYDNLDDITVFLQGDPFGHLQILVGWRDKLTVEEKNIVINKMNTEITSSSKFSTFYQVLYNNPNGTNGCDLIQNFNEIFEIQRYNFFTISPGAQYIVPKDNILSRSKSFYEKLYNKLVSDSTGKFGYVLEHFWYYIFTNTMNSSVGNHDTVKFENQYKKGFHHNPLSYWN